MYKDRIYFTPQDLYEKEFKIDARGYRPQEVDKLLDIVIRDYTEYESIIKVQEKKLSKLESSAVELFGEDSVEVD